MTNRFPLFGAALAAVLVLSCSSLVAAPPPPAVFSISPSTGTAAGGTSVQIIGSNFLGTTGVNFGGTPAAFFFVAGPTEVDAVSPPGVGAVDIRVTTAGGTSQANPTDVFTYTPTPTIPALSTWGLVLLGVLLAVYSVRLSRQANA